MLSPVFMLVLAEADKGALWYFKQMDAAGLAVAVVLLICSFIGWGAMIQKWSDIHEHRRRNHAFERRLRDEPAVVALNFPRGSNLGPYEFLVAEAVSAVQRHKGRLSRPADVTLCMGHVENAVQRGVARTPVVRHLRRGRNQLGGHAVRAVVEIAHEHQRQFRAVQQLHHFQAQRQCFARPHDQRAQ